MMKIKTILYLSATTLLITALSGCASDSKKVVDLNLGYVTKDSVPVKTNDIQQQDQIAEAASSINQSLSQLSAMQQATNPTVNINPTITVQSTGMTEVTSIDYNGDLETVLKNIGDMSGYKVKVVGTAPAIPVIINLNAKNQVLADILQNVAYQAAKQSTITVDADTQTINLAYHAY